MATPLAAGSSLSSNGMAPWTTEIMPGKYMEPKIADISRAAIRGATVVEERALGMFSWGPMMIFAARVGASGRRPAQVNPVGVERRGDLGADQARASPSR